MKKSIIIIPLIILSLTVASSVSSKKATGQDHRMRDGDIINPLVSKDRNAITSKIHLLPDDVIKTVNDTSSYEFVEVTPELFYDDEETARAMIFSKRDTIYFIRNGVRHIYLQTNDTLGYLGYDSRLTRLRLDHVVPVAVYPLGDVNILTGTATATVEYSQQSLLRRASVASRSETAAGLKTADEDVLPDNLTRLEWRMDLTYDSIFNNTVTGTPTMERLSRTFTEWYADGLRYPVLRKETTHAIKLQADTTGLIPSDTLMTYSSSYLHTPQQQYADTGDGPVPSQRINQDVDRETYCQESTCQESTFPVTISHTEMDSGNVTVIMRTLTDIKVTVTASVHTLSGILLSGPVTADVREEGTAVTMKLSREYGEIPILVLATTDGKSKSFPLIR